jgi:hypothetical protein
VYRAFKWPQRTKTAALVRCRFKTIWCVSTIMVNKLVLNQLFCLHQSGGIENKPRCKRVSYHVAQPGSPSVVLCMICNIEFLNHQMLIHSAYKPVLCLSPSLPYTSRNGLVFESHIRLFQSTPKTNILNVFVLDGYRFPSVMHMMNLEHKTLCHLCMP